MKAFLKNYRQSPRKVRLVANFVRGKKVDAALVELEFMPKRASRAVSKLIASAKANAANNFKVLDDLFIKEITVDDGPTMKRFRPVSRGRAHKINKRTSHINVVLGLVSEKNQKRKVKKSVEVEKVDMSEVKSEKKPATKKTATLVKKTVNKKNS